MKNNDIIEFIRTKISREFNLEDELDGISIHIVGSLAIKIRLGRSLENYFNGESDIDCIVVVLENGIITQNSKIFERKVLDTFLNNQVDVINYSIVYGKKRNRKNSTGTYSDQSNRTSQRTYCRYGRNRQPDSLFVRIPIPATSLQIIQKTRRMHA